MSTTVTTPGSTSPGASSLLGAALTAFRETGYHGASVRDIARAAGVTPAAVYHHFESKQEMLVTIMHKAMSENLASVEEAAARAAEDGAPAQLGAMVAAIVDYHTAHPAEAFVGNSELRSLEPEGRERVVALRDREERLFIEVIERGRDEGRFVVASPKTAARAIIAMASAVASWYRQDGPLSVEEIRGQYVRLAHNLLEHHG